MLILVLQLLTAVVVGFGLLYVSGRLAQQRTVTRIHAWMMRVEGRARFSGKPGDIIEVPGYQGMIREFRKRWVDGTPEQ